jgi:hypothetical protein
LTEWHGYGSVVLAKRQGICGEEADHVVWQGRQRISGSGGLVALGEAVVPREGVLTFEGTKGSPDVTMRFEVRDGRPECVGVTVEAKPNGRGIRSADMALFNIDSLTVAVFEQLGTIGVRDEAYARRISHDLREARASRRGTVTPEELEEVAKIYREHLAASPTRAVALLGGYSERTAARRIKQAEEAGLLPRTTPGKKRGS